MKNCIRAEDETFVSPPVLSTGPLPTLQQDAHGRLLCKCPACGDEWKVATWPKLEEDAKARGWEEAMERVEENARYEVDKVLSYALSKIEDFYNQFPKNYLTGPVASGDPGAWYGFEMAKIASIRELDEIRRKLRQHIDIYNERP